MITSSRRHFIAVDAAAWFASGWLALLLRFDGSIPYTSSSTVLVFCLVCTFLSLLINSFFWLYSGRYRNASLEEFIAICLASALSVVSLTTLRVFLNEPTVPRSTAIIAGLLAVLFSLAARLLFNPLMFFSMTHGREGKRTLIYGAGIVGRQLVEQMISQKDFQYEAIGFLDDDPSKSRLRILGRPVFGKIDQLEAVFKKEFPEILVVAISGIDSSRLRELDKKCRSLGIVMRVIPTALDIVSGAVQLADIQDISEEDLLGRRRVEMNDWDISKFIFGKKVLITGAGGSIGSEIARQVQSYSPLSLTLVDRDETALLNLQLSMDDTGLLTDSRLVLGDIRDSEKMFRIFIDTSPEIVFHAAALKHLTTLERFPEEATKTNIIGTKNVLEAAQAVGVSTFVNISTDKAAEPSSALGRSKLLAERMTASVRGDSLKYISVRFGNVIGSNGSFIHTFRHQIRRGGPVTVTHPDVTRYFMTVSEAVHLVLQATIIGENSETLILDMGKPVSIDYIAKRMIEISGKNIQIKYVGLREGEKLHEQLVDSNESVVRKTHPYILHTRVPPIEDWGALQHP